MSILKKFQYERAKSQVYQNMPQIEFEVQHLLKQNFLINSYLQFSTIILIITIMIWWLIINIYPMTNWED